MVSYHYRITRRSLLMFFSLGLVVCVASNIIFIRLTSMPLLAIMLLVLPWAQLPFSSKRWRATEPLFAAVMIFITVVFYFCFSGSTRPSFSALQQEAQVLLVGFTSIMFGVSKAAALVKNRFIFGAPKRHKRTRTVSAQ